MKNALRVCVIGAGPSGLTTINQLLNEGHQVTCFENQADIGGIWYRSDNQTADANQMKVFDNLILTISIKLMSYSDFIHKGGRDFYTRKQYWEYLLAYAEKFQLRKHISLNTQVKEIKKQGDGSWIVSVFRNGREESHHFDAVAICAGPFQRPDKSTVPDLDKFAGEVTHSSQYRNNQPFAQRRVLIVGLAESSADIAREISDVASEATLSIRNYSFLLPRAFSGRYATDYITSRYSHYEHDVRSRPYNVPIRKFCGDNIFSRAFFFSLLWVYATGGYLVKLISSKRKESEPEKNPLGQSLYPLKMDIDCQWNRATVEAMNEWNRRSNENGNWFVESIICKNVSFLQNVVDEKLLVNDSGIEKISGSLVFFKNGESKEFDAIVLCTGFVQNFSALGKDLAVKDDNVRNLYRHCIHPDHDGTLAFMGIVRPATGAIPIVSEMQARYFAALCSKKLKVPKDIRERIQREKDWEDAQSRLSPRHPDLIASQILYIDNIAKEVGCLMPVWKLMFQPRLLLRHWFWPYNQTCYRLTGAHSDYQNALLEMMSNKALPGSEKAQLETLILAPLPSSVHPRWRDFPVPDIGDPLPKEHFLSPKNRDG